MSVLEQRYFESVARSAAVLAEALPRIADALESTTRELAEVKAMLKEALGTTGFNNAKQIKEK